MAYCWTGQLSHAAVLRPCLAEASFSMACPASMLASPPRIMLINLYNSTKLHELVGSAPCRRPAAGSCRRLRAGGPCRLHAVARCALQARLLSSINRLLFPPRPSESPAPNFSKDTPSHLRLRHHTRRHEEPCPWVCVHAAVCGHCIRGGGPGPAPCW